MTLNANFESGARTPRPLLCVSSRDNADPQQGSRRPGRSGAARGGRVARTARLGIKRLVSSSLLLTIAGVLGLSSGLAAPVTPERIAALPAAEQPAWRAYLARSQANARADAAALQAEVAVQGLTNALRAPDGGDFKLPAKPGNAYYQSEDARRLADAVLSFQTPSGGWSKHLGFNKGPRQPGMQWTSQNEPGKPPHYVATFDNRSTTEELHFLASVWLATQREDCAAAFRKGLQFILAAQYPNGGWPQVYPLEGGYHDDVTFNDDALTHVLELLYGISRNEPAYAFLGETNRQQAAAALAAGLRCLLQAQVAQDGQKTVWCAQHDPLTLQPASARAMEPASLSGMESARILGFLMTITNPAPDLVAAIESGLAWFERVKLTGLSRVKRDGKTAYETHAASTQVYWARFSDLATSKPIFPGRDGVIYDTFEAMAAKNKLGYDYYGTQPGSLLNSGQKKWRKLLAAKPAK
jgi:PelA/Pel-15E family pectate lyase